MTMLIGPATRPFAAAICIGSAPLILRVRLLSAPQARAEVQQPRQHPRADLAQQQLRRRGRRPEQGGREHGQGDGAGAVHRRDLSARLPFWGDAGYDVAMAAESSLPPEILARRDRARIWFEALRDRICAELERLEDEAPDELYPEPAGCFDLRPWTRQSG